MPSTLRRMRGEDRAISEDPTRDARLLLERELGRPVDLRFGRSRGHPVVARSPSRGERSADPRLPADLLVVRLHASFREAGEDVYTDLASWLRNGRRARAASARLDAWIEDTLSALPPPAARATQVNTRGRVHDLAALTSDVLARDFAADFVEEPPPVVTWGTRRITGARRSLRLGSYEPAGRLVRIHPVLDQPAVPASFVRSVLFHELLHAVLPAQRDSAGRWMHHTREFRRCERAHPDYASAVAFERRHLNALLRSARTGADLVAPRRVAAAKIVQLDARRDAQPGLFDGLQ